MAGGGGLIERRDGEEEIVATTEQERETRLVATRCATKPSKLRPLLFFSFLFFFFLLSQDTKMGDGRVSGHAGRGGGKGLGDCSWWAGREGT